MPEEKEKAPYKLSRSSFREKFGSRSIDAGNRQSPADSTPSGIDRLEGAPFDDTPSGRQREMRRQRYTTNDIEDAEDTNWRSKFGELKPGFQGPFAVFQNRAKAPGDPVIGAINEARAGGAVSGTFNVPQYGGTVGFSPPKPAPTPSVGLAPETSEDVSAMFDLIGGTPMVNSSSLGASSILGRSRYRKSVLDSASRWVPTT